MIKAIEIILAMIIATVVWVVLLSGAVSLIIAIAVSALVLQGDKLFKKIHTWITNKK